MTDQTAEQSVDERSRALTKFDETTLKGILPAAAGVQRAVFLPANFAEALEMSKMLASGIGVRPWCRGNVSACMMIVQQAVRWGMDPYAVANKAYFVNDQVAFESQLVNAVVNTSREIVGRLKIEWLGKDNELVCRVSGFLAADPDDARVLDQPIKTITVRNSPLWTVNPQQQLAYFTTRAWARLYVPEVLLGVYTPDELADGETMILEGKTTGATAAAPDRRDFTDQDGATAEDAQFEPVSEDNAQNGAVDAETTPVDAQSGQSGEKVAQKDDIDAETAPETDPIPRGDKAWASFERNTLNDIDTAPDQDALTTIGKRIAPALNAANQPIRDRIDDAMQRGFADFAGN